jgi:signal transduction histidine kinase
MNYAEPIFGILKRLQGKDVPGLGVDMVICTAVIERYAEIIWANSEEGQGTTLYFTLPNTTGRGTNA